MRQSLKIRPGRRWQIAVAEEVEEARGVEDGEEEDSEGGEAEAEVGASKLVRRLEKLSCDVSKELGLLRAQGFLAGDSIIFTTTRRLNIKGNRVLSLWSPAFPISKASRWLKVLRRFKSQQYTLVLEISFHICTLVYYWVDSTNQWLVLLCGIRTSTPGRF